MLHNVKENKQGDQGSPFEISACWRHCESSGKSERSCQSHSPVPIKLLSLGLMVVYGQPGRCSWVWTKTHSLIFWSCCFTSLQGLCFGFGLQLTGNGKAKRPSSPLLTSSLGAIHFHPAHSCPQLVRREYGAGSHVVLQDIGSSVE